MSIDELKKEVDDIIAISGDDEAAHYNEDNLHMKLLIEHLPADKLKEVLRLEKSRLS